MSQDPVVIVAARRTPMGAFQGALGPVSATELSASASRASIADAGIDAGDVDEILLGCVLPAGLGQAPARQAALAAGVPLGVPCTTVNKVCGSGMKTTMLGHDLILAGSASVVLTGGMESMSNAPYLMPKARTGYRMGHQEVLDHMFFDGLQNPYDGHMMGHFAEQTAQKYGFSREDQDAFAITSVTRARDAAESGRFDNEITPVIVKHRKGETEVTEDEVPSVVDVDRIPTLRPAFAADGTVTAASCRFPGPDAGQRRSAAWHRAAGDDRGSRRIRPRTGVVYDGAGLRDQGAAHATGLVHGFGRPLRD
jgi:acetyl-CoA C-acetyltransferase